MCTTVQYVVLAVCDADVSMQVGVANYQRFGKFLGTLLSLGTMNHTMVMSNSTILVMTI